MRQILWCSAVLVCFLATVAESKSLSKREANYASAYEHGEVHHVDLDKYKDKKKVEVTFGVKNALIGFVFDKINKFIDHKTHWVAQLDKQNILKNKAQHIYPPADPKLELSSLVSGFLGQKIEAAAPVLHKLASGSSGGSGSNHGGGFNLGALVGGH
ncbi:uncharacterized protein LOC132704694 isoform X2 [Cylas formicarius]|uniref:uncharacterized protein LOC132704694 isoform X2 n=1 Tax=Cylas formicarius TaxID=197179 RepID=UPI002958C465|nr:uncharacterized protein LOC132704694 isoform X2 [Cylas formicarius]